VKDLPQVTEISRLGRFTGCLLGGAIGDALGAPVEFMSLPEIRRQFGPEGIRHYAPAYGRPGAITDDTQMTLFTAEGLIRARQRHRNRGICDPAMVVWHAYLRWLGTQGIQRFDEACYPETHLASRMVCILSRGILGTC
jgi:ADP-ribosylglycohydrolase